MSESEPGSGPVPAPPSPFAAEEHALPAGTRLYRTHRPRQVLASGDVVDNDGTLFNPADVRYRFSPFGEPITPVLYAGLTPEVAVFEGPLHDAVPGGAVLSSAWERSVLSVLETTRPLRLAKLFGTGLGRFGLTGMHLTDTDALHYGSTVSWGEAAWLAGFDGIAYVARHHSPDLAVVLFERSTEPPCVRACAHDSASRVFLRPADRSWLQGLANRIDVILG